MHFIKLILILFLGATLLVSCKNETKTKPITDTEVKATAEVVTLLENPTSGNSAYPRLFGTEDNLFMSWIEERDSISILYFSTLENGAWTKPVEVNSGTDWFIN